MATARAVVAIVVAMVGRELVASGWYLAARAASSSGLEAELGGKKEDRREKEFQLAMDKLSDRKRENFWNCVGRA